ncbi:MAG: ImmA/IrrE family metallo-endopeptidase [Rhodothermaceae bacterium]|nr:ImmA/IrrE family metallo-endopeptidase [Rhodothermaceae bacterium]MYG68686.1 ImmA/IrrE family metallo-endopeptidase [Rhodothermaceae bacterium]MYJ44368.1 ImmA/IrrE family metallo-endopeptidase [Rhodothermaceae bacterium]
MARSRENTDIWSARGKARTILAHYGLERGAAAYLRDIACDRGLIVLDKPIRGAEGRLVQLGDRAIATVNKSIDNLGKRTFVLAHEFGHYELQHNTHIGCEDAAFVDWHRKRPQETEANQFAAELLMPKRWFIETARNRLFSLDTVKDIANICQVSVTAAAFRCVELDICPSALVFCQSGLIQWYTVSESLPYKRIPHGTRPHRYSGAGEYFVDGGTSPDPEKTPMIAWFIDDNIPPDELVMEQCLPMPNLDSTLSLIWIP